MTEAEQAESLANIRVRSLKNITRVADLVDIASSVFEQLEPEKAKSLGEEILRAVVVFMHAVLEDTLREIARVELGQSSPEVLDVIPLIGTSLTGQPRRFSLGALSTHRGKTVDELIQESVDEFLDRTSFNSSKDIASTLERCRVDLTSLRKYFSTLDEAISRRHQIVHRADWVNDDVGNWTLARIEGDDVKRWSISIGLFIIELISVLTHGSMDKAVAESPPDAELTEDFINLGKEAGIL